MRDPAGLVPTAFGPGRRRQQRAAIAVTIIGGQSLCLFLTLLLVPVAYVKLDVLEQASMQRIKDGSATRSRRLSGGLRPRGATREALTSMRREA